MTNLKIIRKQAKIKQKVVAELLGVTAATVRNWETGFSMPKLNQLVQMAKIYNVSIATLVEEA
jgi:transcriptional regulator with XRE-family HTH domain